MSFLLRGQIEGCKCVILYTSHYFLYLSVLYVTVMVNLAQPIQTDTITFSVPELNQRMIARMTGTQMGTWDFATKPINVLCLADGAGFYKGHFYMTGDDGTVYDMFRIHNHSSSAEGSSLYDIMMANAKNVIGFDGSDGVGENDFHMKTFSGVGVLATEANSNQMYTKFLTDTAANDYVNVMRGGGRLSFGSPMTMQLKYGMSHNVGALLKIGTGTTTVENAAGAASQIGFEHCSATNTSIGVFTADGTVRQTDYLTNVVQSVPYGLRFDYYPSSKVIAKNGAGLEVIHTSNLPSISAATNSDSVFRAGVKTTNTTAKTFKLYALRYFGYSYDATTGIFGWC